jgi:hypothetical protein
MDEPVKFIGGCWTGRRWRCCAVGLVSHAGPATRSSNRHPVLERQRGARSGIRAAGATPPTSSCNCRLKVGSVALHCNFVGSTENLVDAIVRGYEGTIPR